MSDILYLDIFYFIVVKVIMLGYTDPAVWDTSISFTGQAKLTLLPEAVVSMWNKYSLISITCTGLETSALQVGSPTDEQAMRIESPIQTHIEAIKC